MKPTHAHTAPALLSKKTSVEHVNTYDEVGIQNAELHRLNFLDRR